MASASAASNPRLGLPSRSDHLANRSWRGSTLPYQPVYGKDGRELLWYLVRMPNGSWMQPNAGLWMTFNFHGAERLSEISAGQD
jgi:hypothetical protein